MTILQKQNGLQVQSGMSLIETMVAMAIGMFLILGAVTVYTQGRASFQTTEGISRTQENMRFAFDVLEPDIRLAGYWGMHNDGVIVDGVVSVSCEGNDVTGWVMNSEIGLDARNNITAAKKDNVADGAFVAANCPSSAGGIKTGTDVLEIRHASGDKQALKAGTVQVQSELAKSRIFSNGSKPGGFNKIGVNETGTFDYIFSTYYIANDSNNMTGVPSLRRKTLDGTTVVDEEVIAGVDNMQIQLGLDTNGDAAADRYVDPVPGSYNSENVVSVRLWLLMRADADERGFTDTRSYELPDGTTVTPSDGYRRMKASKMIYLRN